MAHDMQIRRARSQQLGDLLRRSAARVPDTTALVFRNHTDTYAELDSAVNRAANALAVRGITKGDRVALFTHNNRAFVVLRFAIARLGAIVTPINFMLNAEDFAYVLDHSGARMLIAEDALCPVADSALGTLGRDIPKLSIPHTGAAAPDGWEPVASILDHDDDTEVWTDLRGDDPVQMMYTSGTESRPKGALLSSDALYAQYVSCIVDGEMTADAVSLHCLPFPQPRSVPRRHVYPARKGRPCRYAGRDRGTWGYQAVLPADDLDRAVAPSGFRQARSE